MSLVQFAGTVTLLTVRLNTTDPGHGKGEDLAPGAYCCVGTFSQRESLQDSFSRSAEYEHCERP